MTIVVRFLFFGCTNGLAELTKVTLHQCVCARMCVCVCMSVASHI